jgi:membrane protease YdiL (CAAX protease family)
MADQITQPGGWTSVAVQTPSRILKLSHFGAILIVFYLLPYLWMAIGTWDYLAKIGLSTLVVTLLVGYLLYRRIPPSDLGLRQDTLRGGLLWFGLFSVVMGALAYWGTQAQWFRQSPQPSGDWLFFLFYIFVATPAQELVYRGLLFSELRRAGLNSPWLQILISGSTFALLHLHHHDPWTLGLTFGMGTAWAWLYWRWPNLLAATLSHNVLGCLAFLVKLI